MKGEVTQTTKILNVEALHPEYRDYITHAMHIEEVEGGTNPNLLEVNFKLKYLADAHAMYTVKSNEKCSDIYKSLVSISCFYINLEALKRDFLLYPAQVDVMCETHQGLVECLACMAAQLGGSKGICNVLK